MKKPTNYSVGTTPHQFSILDTEAFAGAVIRQTKKIKEEKIKAKVEVKNGTVSNSKNDQIS